MLFACSAWPSELFSALAWSGISAGWLYVLAIPGYSKLREVLFENKVIVQIGKASLELFLIHQLAIRYCVTLFRKLGSDSNVLVYAVAFAGSWLFYCLVQKVRANTGSKNRVNS